MATWSPTAGPDAVTAELYTQAALAGGWDVVPQDDVVRAMTNLPPTTPQNLDENAIKLGHALSVNGVLYGVLERYREREGLDYAAASPASVAFALKFVDMQTEQVVWTRQVRQGAKGPGAECLRAREFCAASGAMGSRARDRAGRGRHKRSPICTAISP